MSCANDTTRLLVASDISTFMFEINLTIGSVRSPNRRRKTWRDTPTYVLHSKSYPEIAFVRSQVVSSMAMGPTGSFINEQSVTIPNLLYNWIVQHAYWLPLTFQPLCLKWVELIGPQSIQLYNKFGMVTDCSFIKLPVSFAHDIIYDVTRGKVKNPETCKSGCIV
jgi:hypothetical protein